MLPTQKQTDFVRDMAELLGCQLPDMTDRSAVVAFINKHKYEYYRKKDMLIRDKIIEECSILDFAEEIGFHLKKGARYYSLMEHDSVRIRADGKRYWRNSVAGEGGSVGKGGTVIDFAIEFCNMDTHKALRYFTEKVMKDIKLKPVAARSPKTDQGPKKEKKNLVLPNKAQDMRRVYAYLTKSRMICKDIVQDFVDDKMLYQDTFGNCVFVGYKKGIPVFATRRGTTTHVRFTNDVPGCDYGYGFYIDNGSGSLIVTESVIDAMSIMTILHRQKRDYRAYDYLALAGTGKVEALEEHLKEKKDVIRKVIAACDNDEYGRLCAENIKKMVSHYQDIDFVWKLPKKEKDWNEELQESLIHGIYSIKF